MSTIYTMHGVVPNATPPLFAHRNLLDMDDFIDHLRTMPRPYVDLFDALNGKGDALTVDDATQTGATAARLARDYGHAVALFINPYNIHESRMYYFLLLNLMLDATEKRRAEFAGEVYDLTSREGKKSLRRSVKHVFCGLPAEEERQTMVARVGLLLGVENVSMPSYLQTLSLIDLLELRDRGVRLENHGWTHTYPTCLTPNGIATEIQRGREWLRTHCGVDATVYAVPFGDCLPQAKVSDLYHTWLLSNDVLYAGHLGPSVFNRRTLTVSP